ncbi:MAG: winged helix-turn-helix domain-containing protein [Oligoflexales bacterium]
MGFSYKKPKGRPAKADPDLQETFVRKYRGLKPHGPCIFRRLYPSNSWASACFWMDKKGSDFEVKATP